MRFQPIIYIGFFTIISIIGCQRNTKKDFSGQPAYNDLISIAKSETLTLKERYNAILKADKFAEEQKKVTLKIESLRIMSMLLLRMDSIDKAATVCRSLAILASGEDDKESAGVAFNNLALIKTEHSEYDSAILFYNNAARLFRSISDTLREVQCKINTGIVYKNIGAFEKAFSISVEAARTLSTMNASDEIGVAYTTIGNTLKDLRRFEEALTYHNDALAIREKLADSIGIAGSLNNIGNVYKTSKKFEKALPFFVHAMEIKKRVGSARSRAITYDNLAETMIGLGNYESAATYANLALELRDQQTDRDGWMATAAQLAAIHLARNETSSALALALTIEQLANSPNYLKHQIDNALLLEELYNKTNNLNAALRYAHYALSLKDSLFSKDMSTAISDLQVRYRTEEQRQKFEQSDKDNQAKANEIKRQTYFILLLVAVVLLLLVVLYLLYLSNRQRTKARKKTELLLSEMDHRVKNNLQIINGILNLQISESVHSETIAALTAAKNRIQSIGIVHALLYQKEYTGKVDMDQFAKVIAQNISHAFSKKTHKPDYNIISSGVQLKADDAVLFGIIINELLTNIYKYAKPSGETLAIEIGISSYQNLCKLLITDNGIAWQPPAKEGNKNGLGMQLIYMLAEQAHASVLFEREGLQNKCSITFESN